MLSSTAADMRPLGLADACIAARTWLAFIGEHPTEVEEPTGGIVHLRTDSYVVRLRVGPEPASQGTVLAMLRAGVEIQGQTMMMFSPNGYNSAAIEFAEFRKIPIFTLTPLGDVVGETVAARSLIPEREYVAPFADRDEEEETVPESEPEPEPEYQDRFEAEPGEWKACPRCAAHQHPGLAQCASCGADLNGRVTVIGGGSSAGHILQSRTAPSTGPRPGFSSLRCRNCGSHDIELTHG